MKKYCLIICWICILLFLNGCSLGKEINKSSAKKEEVLVSGKEEKKRVYIDEIDGTVQTADEEELVLLTADEMEYRFDICEASLECKVKKGSTVSVIYEGKRPEQSADTEKVKALKVTELFHGQDIANTKPEQ